MAIVNSIVAGDAAKKQWKREYNSCVVPCAADRSKTPRRQPRTPPWKTR